jgi:hypothetical protein
MTMSVARLALGGRAEHGGDVVEALDVGLGCEIQINDDSPANASFRLFSVLLPLQVFHDDSP